MTTSLKKNSLWQKQASYWLIGLVVLGLMALMGYLNQFHEPIPVMRMTPAERENRDHIYAIVLRSHGDFNQINPEDKKWLMKMTGRIDFAQEAYDDVKSNPHPRWW